MSASFDERAAQWDSDPVRVDRARAVSLAIRNALPLSTEMRAIEVGCGTGLLSFALQPHLGHITLADSSPGMLAVLRDKIAGLRMTNMAPLLLDITAGPLPGEQFDLVYSLMALHHIPDTQAALRAFAALTRSNGFLCIADLDSEDGSFHGPGIDVHPGFARPALEAGLAGVGFGDIRFTTAYRMPRHTPRGAVFYPLFLATAARLPEPGGRL